VLLRQRQDLIELNIKQLLSEIFQFGYFFEVLNKVRKLGADHLPELLIFTNQHSADKNILQLGKFD